MKLKENKNINLADEAEKKAEEPVKTGITYTEEEKEVILYVKERYDRMKKKKDDLGINNRCDLYDRLYTPHRLLKIKNTDNEFERSHLQFSDEDGRKANKSKPVAFEKIQTALAVIIKKNPKAFMKAFNNKYRALNEIVKAAFEHNWDENRTNIELRKFVFHLAKYGIAYGRRYIKKTYKIIHRQTENGLIKERVVKFYDTIFETIHPKNVLLDDCADNPRTARDCFFVFDQSLQNLKDKYPVEMFPRMVYVNKGRWLTEKDGTFLDITHKTQDVNRYEEAIYENEYKDVKLTFVNGILIKTEPLPAHQLSLVGEKWADKDESYDGIGICQVLENYQPLIDEISNSDIDLVREVVRPKLYMGTGLSISDEGEDEINGQQLVRFDGDINQLKWDRPTRTYDGSTMLEALSKEVDDATGIAKDLSAESDAATLGQAAYNRENSLRRLALPLEAVKYMLEDDANKALPLLKIIHSKPIKVYEIENPQELAEAQAIVATNPLDDRFVVMPDGKIIRRQFKEIDVQVDLDPQSGNYIQSEDSKFWEMVPATFDWKGKINIIPMSFVDESESMEQQATLQDLNILLPIQDTDQMGMPVLVDESGMPYKINKVKLIKDYLQSRKKNKDEYIIPLQMQNISGSMDAQAMTNPANLAPTQSQQMGLPANSQPKGAAAKKV